MTAVTAREEQYHVLASNLRVDAVTARVTRAMTAAGIPNVLHKGPVTAAWLYESSPERSYADTDLLVRAADWDRAVAVLESLGFHDHKAPLRHGFGGFASTTFTTGTADVDLHCTLAGVGVPPERAWEPLTRDAEQRTVAGAAVTTLGPAARCLQLPLHALNHRAGHPIEDLRRALELVPYEDWRAAAALAAELDATPAFATGLGMLEEGEALASRLGLAGSRSVQTVLRVRNVPLSEGLDRLARTRGVREKLHVLRRELLPAPAFMRSWSRLARAGRVGLVLAYPWRLAWLAAHAPRALWVWLAARNEVSRSEGGAP